MLNNYLISLNSACREFNQANNKTDWLKSSLPYRSPNKIKELYFNKFGKKDISINDIKQNIEHYNNFNIKQNQKKFSLKTYSNIFHSFIGDIFFESNKAAFLLFRAKKAKGKRLS